METLASIFGSAARVKIMRFFLFHADKAFDTAEISKKSMVARATATKELIAMQKVGFLEKKKFTRITERQLKSGAIKEMKRTGMGFMLNAQFSLLDPLRDLLINSELVKTKDIMERLQKAGTLKLLAMSGVLIHEPRRSIDLLVVGENLDHQKTGSLVEEIEAEIGTEIQYSVFTTDEFRYRLDMCDKLLRDVFDYQHKLIVDKLKLDYSS